jgi:serine/threonine protein phosphatase 1
VTVAFIGDIHGCIEPTEEIVSRALLRCSTLVFLGDYIDRGVHPVEVLDLLIGLQDRTDIEVHFLEGNHDMEFRKVLNGGELDTLLRMGGAPTVGAYVEQPYGDVARQLREAVPSAHRNFFENLHKTFEIENLVAVHDAREVRADGRYVIAGHATRRSLRPQIGKSLALIDTGCGTASKGMLTCLYWPELTWDQSSSAWSDE